MPQDREDPEAHRRQVALFRSAIISDLDIEALPRGERSARLVELATRMYRVPEGGERRFSIRTLWAWWSAYRDHGLDGLQLRIPAIVNARIAARRASSPPTCSTPPSACAARCPPAPPPR